MRAVVAIVVLALAAPAAHADPKKLTTAQAFSGVGTGVSGALFLSAFLISQTNGDVKLPLVYVAIGTSVLTPALGHWYAGRYLTPGMGIRAAAAAFSTWGVIHYSQTVRCNNTVEFKECTGLKREAIVVLGISAIAFVGGAAYDFKTLSDSVDRYNVSMQLTPTIMPTTTGGPAAGLALSGTF